MQEIWQRRLRDLEEHVEQSLELLRQYEGKLRLEDDPRKTKHYRESIEELKASARAYQQEYEQLRRELGTASAPVSEGVAERLDQIDTKLDDLLASHGALRQDISMLRGELLTRYEASERTTVAELARYLNETQIATVQAVLDALEDERRPEEQVSEAEMRELLTAVQSELAALRQQGKPVPGEASVAKVIADPALDVKHKLKVTLPIIPTVLAYEAEVALGSGMNLKAAWGRLMQKLG